MNRLWHTTTLAESASLCVLITAAIYMLCTANDDVRRLPFRRPAPCR